MKHGTPDGYNQHIKRREKPCDPCRVAIRAYGKKWRAEHPEKMAKQAAYNRRRQRAMAALARKHPDEMFQIMHALEQAEIREQKRQEAAERQERMAAMNRKIMAERNAG